VYPVAVRYQEYCEGVLRRIYDLNSSAISDTRIRYDQERFSSFDTQALVLQFQPGSDEATVQSLCVALRYLLPVHIGVEEDALEIVSIAGQIIDDQRMDGIAIVDV